MVPTNCDNEVIDLLVGMRQRATAAREGGFGAGQNAEVVAGAERYYRAMVRGGRTSWNVRDRHMDDTLDRLLEHYGPRSKAIVWAHNTHVGDARATDMAATGTVNIGQLARERYGPDQVVLVGFGTHHGTVVAGSAWGAPIQIMGVPPGRRGSMEEVLDTAASGQALFVFPRDDRPSSRPGALAAYRGWGDASQYRSSRIVSRPPRASSCPRLPGHLTGVGPL